MLIAVVSGEEEEEADIGDFKLLLFVEGKLHELMQQMKHLGGRNSVNF